MIRSLGLAGLALGILGVAACGSSTHTASPPASPSTTSASTSSTSATSVPSSSSPSSSAAPVATTVPAVLPCATSELTGSLGPANGTAGTTYYQLELTNSGAVTCTLQGYPGVSFVAGSHGTQIGAAAMRETGPAPVVTLNPGQSASSTLGIVDASNYGPSCGYTNVLGLRVYPPDQLTSLFVSHTDTGCANSADVVLNVRPLTS